MQTRERDNNTNELLDGGVVRIKCVDFLTYDDCEILPGPNLNTIIGPNGTGKSSIICALCLGLGGKPADLGRSSDVWDFIKHGKEKATVEIELKDSKKPHNTVIRMVIGPRHSKDTKQQFYIDGKRIPQRELAVLVKDKYKIQVDNPCSFLAQDKVKDFAIQTPQKLLENTEKTIEPDLYDIHQELKDHQDEGEMVQEELRRIQQDLKSKTTRIEALEPEVKEFYERKRLEQKLKNLNIKKTSLEYGEKRKELTKVKEELANFKKSLVEKETQFAPREEAIKKLKQTEKQFGGKMELQREKLKLLAQSEERKYETIEKCSEKIAEVKIECADRQEKRQKLLERIANIQGMIENHNTQLASLTEHNSEPQQRLVDQNIKTNRDNLDSVQEKINDFEVKLKNLNYEKSDINRRLLHAQNADNRKLQRMSGFNRDASEMYQWYLNNKNKFQHDVFVPFFNIKVNNPSDAIFLENCISYRDTFIFIFGSAEDEKLLLNEAKGHGKRISSAVVKPRDIRIADKIPLPSCLADLGFRDFVYGLFSAPPAVKQYVCNVFRVHNIPVGGDKVENNLEQVTRDPNISQRYNLFLTKNRRLQIKKSSYSGNVSTTDSSLHPAKFFHLVDESDSDESSSLRLRGQRLNQQCQSVTAQMENLSKQKEQYNRENEKMRTQKKQLLEQQNKRQAVGRQIKECKTKLEIAQNSLDKLNSGGENIKKVISDQTSRACDLLNEVTKIVESKDSRLTELALLSLQMVEYGRQIEKKELVLSRDKVSLQEDKNRIATKDQQIKRVEGEVRIARDKFKDLLGLPSIDRNKLTGGDQQKFDAIMKKQKKLEKKGKKDLLSVEAAIAQEEARIEVQGRGNKAAVDEYNELKRETEMLRELETQKIDKLAQSRLNYAGKRDDWKKRLDELIESISENYSGFFEKLGWVGQVSLNIPDNSEDFANYGIDIFVKFRDNEQLQRLTAQRQSGGERSVSTMLYILALQKMSKVPFRCVDEINQGMDAQNERLVFNMMVKLLSEHADEDDSNLANTQYFMLTPKLLPDLHFSSKMTVLLVNNGPGSLSYKEFSTENTLAVLRGL